MGTVRCYDFRMRRGIPSLDGLRGICISLVLFAHVQGTANFPSMPPIRLGRLGVAAFFVISGYLITMLLMKERAATGRVAVREFYLRRAVRLLPAFYALVAVAVVLEALGILQLRSGDLLAAATQTMNFHGERAWWLGHTWNLAAQMQFYLVWPLALAFLGTAGSLRIALGAFAVAPLLRVAVFYGWPAQRALVDQAFPLVFDGLATGCLLAFLRERLWGNARYRGLLESSLFAAVPFVVLLAYLYRPSVGVSMIVQETVVNVGIAACVDWAMRFHGSRVGRILNAPAVTWVGTISYSLYLWQQLFLARSHRAWFTSFPLNLLLAFAAATASYYLLEKPLGRLRARLAAPLPRLAGAPTATQRP